MPKKFSRILRCPKLLTGRNSVIPCTIANKITYKTVILFSFSFHTVCVLLLLLRHINTGQYNIFFFNLQVSKHLFVKQKNPDQLNMELTGISCI
ncbi:hypothetical protein DXC01_17960 [Blautia sp. OM07-19]|nr:hypothetical protein DXC01_17960 [Blautia sp. OM07-19]